MHSHINTNLEYGKYFDRQMKLMSSNVNDRFNANDLALEDFNLPEADMQASFTVLSKDVNTHLPNKVKVIVKQNEKVIFEKELIITYS